MSIYEKYAFTNLNIDTTSALNKIGTIANNKFRLIHYLVSHFLRRLSNKKYISLDIWTGLSTSYGARDKLLKTIQYACQFLLWYYRENITDSGKTRLNSAKLGAAMGRKAFRLFRTMNHVASVIKAIPQWKNMYESKDYSQLWLRLASLGENIGYGVYYWYDNQIFCNRTKLLEFDEPLASSRANAACFVADLSCFIVAILKLSNCRKRNSDIILRINQINSNKPIADNDDNTEDELEIKQLEIILDQIEAEEDSAYQDLIINFLEVVVSANCAPIDIWKKIFGPGVIHDGHEGVSGFLSAILTIYSIWPRN